MTTHKVGQKSVDVRRNPSCLRTPDKAPHFLTYRDVSLHRRCTRGLRGGRQLPAMPWSLPGSSQLWSASENFGNSLVKAASTACSYDLGEGLGNDFVTTALVDPGVSDDVVHEIANAPPFDIYTGLHCSSCFNPCAGLRNRSGADSLLSRTESTNSLSQLVSFKSRQEDEHGRVIDPRLPSLFTHGPERLLTIHPVPTEERCFRPSAGLSEPRCISYLRGVLVAPCKKREPSQGCR